MLHLHTSNRPEALAGALAERMRTAPLPLLEAEPVIVPSTAVARRLEFALADALGIATRIDFAFPAAYVWRLFGRVLPDVGATSPFDRASMQWRLFRLLGESNAAEIGRYLAGDDGSRRFELAARLAGLFDRYLVERPGWIAAWSAGRHLGLGMAEHWQADLWRMLVQEIAPEAAAHPRERFFACLREAPSSAARLPRRIALFCVEAMPVLYWEVFVALADWIEVHVFALSPSREYWGDIARERERLRMAVEQPELAVLFESPHRLLASLARVRRPVAVRLADTLFASENENFLDPPASLLGRLQGDLLDLTESRDVQPDASIQVHACHGAMREAEVLHDRLLSLFETLPDLTPADILILTPDIDTSGPLIEAVLTHAPAGRRIPCTVCDRALAQSSGWRALRRLCAAAGGELDAESVLAPLEEPAVRRAWRLAEGELGQLRDWVATAGIRWGMDAADRAHRGLPPEDAHSWRTGMNRLLYGLAMPDAERLVGGVLPVMGIEGSRAELLGRFFDYVEALFELAKKVDGGGTGSAWCDWLLGVFGRFVMPSEEEEDDAQRIRAALVSLAGQSCLAKGGGGQEASLPLAVILRELDAQLEAKASASAFARGRATIAALQPGRPLAARVICLVGMNEGSFPRPGNVPGFDLMARHPRPGDRERRGEERYAFLETLLCARDAIIITFTGRDPCRDTRFPPAAPLAELLDCLAAMTGRTADDLVVQHPLQAFSPGYFDASHPERFSYEAEHCAGAILARAAQPPRPFLPLIPFGEEKGDEVVEVEQLRRFLKHPLRYFLRERLGIELGARESVLEIHEPFVPDHLLAYRLRAAFFEGWRAGRSTGEIAQLLAAQGALPHGVAGTLACELAQEEAAPLWESARPWALAPALPPCPISFTAGSLMLDGILEGICAAGCWRVRHGRIRAEDRLMLWLDHLLLHIAAPAGVPMESVLIAPEGEMRLGPLDDAAGVLNDLLDLYASRLPPMLFPETAWTFVSTGKWERAWRGDEYHDIPGERDDPYVRLALRDGEGAPPGKSFQDLAMRVFLPIQKALKGAQTVGSRKTDEHGNG